MIISKTPLRMSFVGGGSDMPAYYRRKRGAVISTAINKYIYVNINKKFDSGIRVGYSINEEVNDIKFLEHKIVKNVLEFLKISGGVEITTIADIPSKGTGLGSSSSFTVGLINGLNAYLGKYATPSYLGKFASHIEISMCGEPIGMQDQYAAAYGGFNLIEFCEDDSVIVSPIVCSSSTIKNIQDNTLMLYTGITRSASALLKEQSSAVENELEKQLTLDKMVGLAYQLRSELQNNNSESMGQILHESWILKKSLNKGISTPTIDDWYDRAIKTGAIGGKILGAGAGGFLMLYAPKEKHKSIVEALPELMPVPVEFEKLGSQIVFCNN